MKIPNSIIPGAYEVSKKVFEGKLTLTKGKKLLSQKNEINENSAGDYINNFRYLMEGQVFQRTLNSSSMDYFLEHIYKDFGTNRLSNALAALQQHITYYEGIHGRQTTMHNMRKLVKKYSTIVYDETLITTREQLLKNIDTVEFYLTEGTDEERKLTATLIKNGICFVAYQVNDELRFVPSRFLGYIDNNLEKHLSSKDKDGNDTNAAINAILGGRPIPDTSLEKKYISYCSKFGIIPGEKFRATRKFWAITLDRDFKENIAQTGEFPEGRIIERIHKARERNIQVIQIAKDNFKKRNGKLFCEACGFNFEKVYGEIGKDLIEGHHTIAVSDMQPDHKTRPEDIAMLCANCHRIVHKKRPWLTMDGLRQLLNAE